MTPPRDVPDYEAQARELVARGDETEMATAIAAALRAAERSGLERAAEYVEAFDGYTNAARFAKEIRALIAPAPESPPAPDYDPITAPIPEGDMNGPHGPLPDPFAGHSDAQSEPPRWRIGRHYGIHVYRGEVPIATFHTVDNAKVAVRAYNASLDRSAPAPDLAAQLDELSNALASHADAETGAKWDRLRAAVCAHDERMAALEAALAKAHDTIRWACGDEPLKDGRWFDCRAFGHEDNAAPPYWWRSILRLYSGLPDDPSPSKEPPP